MKQKIAIRVDADHNIGFGHLSRCLVLAKEIKNKIGVIFLCKNKEAINFIKKNKFKVYKIHGKKETDEIKRLIFKFKINKSLIDLKENVGKEYINKLKKIGVKTILLDNIGEGRKNADIVIYPVAHFDKKYFKEITGKLYYGWDYVIVDKKFFGKRKTNRGKPKILVSMGGSDVYNLTPKIVNILKNFDYDFICTVVIGPGFKNKNIKINDKRFVIRRNVKDMANLMLSSDIGIIWFGVSAYEAAAARLPSTITGGSKKDIKIVNKFTKFGTSIYIERKQLTSKLLTKLKLLLENKELREKMKRNSTNFLKRKRLIYLVVLNES